MDWGLGCYEYIAAQLRPAAVVAINRAGPGPDEHVVDVGCGTGNASLLAGALGARVTGVDPAPRLLHVAEAAAAAGGFDARFLQGEAAQLPLADSSADAVVSVFGVIFAPKAFEAAAEMARVTTPDGRIVLTAWMPGGALGEVIRLRRGAIAATGESTGPLPFDWHEQEAVASLLGPHGFSVECDHQQLVFSGSSPQEFLEAELRLHPGWIAARAVLEPQGAMQSVRARALKILEAANEDAAGFRITSQYVVTTARRG
jgi:SAM-dependent methyltransferase